MNTFKVLTIRYELMVSKVWCFLGHKMMLNKVWIVVNKVWVVVNKVWVMIVITNSGNTVGQRTLGVRGC